MIEVLLVDDETYLTESLFCSIPWIEIGVSKVYQAASAWEAIEILEENQIDILVTDIRMPEMNGFELLEVVAERWPAIKCLMLTGHSDFEYAKRALRLQAVDYILKPVDDQEFIKSMASAIRSYEEEGAQVKKYNRMVYNRKSDFTVLRASLMQSLLLGRITRESDIRQKLEEYEISLTVGESVLMLLLQVTSPHADSKSIELLEFAVGNIAEEIFGDIFRVWQCKAPHNCLIVVLARKLRTEGDEPNPDMESALRHRIMAFRENVSHHLKCRISIYPTTWFQFPNELASTYRLGLSELFLTQKGEACQQVDDLNKGRDSEFRSVELLYKPPSLIQLLESNQWEAASRKINEVFEYLSLNQYSREHLYEVIVSIANAFIFTAHKQGHYLYQIDESSYDPFLDTEMMNSMDQIRIWADNMLRRLSHELAAEDRHNKSHIIKQVQEMITSSSGQDITVKAVADRMFLHPGYLSTIFKEEMGESLGEYIIRNRMEKAQYLLRYSNKKIYEITTELGYQNPQYFSKLFKKFYGLTPNEYRD